MSELTINGKIVKILDPVNGTSKAGKEWSKQEFIIRTTDQFPKMICCTLFGDKVGLIQNLSLEDEVDVSFNLESREFNERWFHNINAWKIEVINNSKPDTTEDQNAAYKANLNNNPPNPIDNQDPPPNSDDVPY